MARDRNLALRDLRQEPASLVLQLEKADDCLTFRLLDLAAELRNHIYTYYMDSLHTVPTRFVQPPICAASRQLRHETIPLFYSRCRFSFDFTMCQDHWDYLFLNDDTRSLLAGVKQQDLALIKIFELNLINYDREGPPRDDGWVVDLNNQEDSVRSLWNDFDFTTYERAMHLMKTVAIREVVVRVLGRPGKLQLWVADVEALAVAMDGGYNYPRPAY
jgi:hypothetical protein